MWLVEPNLFLVGAAKAGTSTLHLWLDQHPDIGMSRPKELHFFCHCPKPSLHVASDLPSYLTHFSSQQVVGESSPCYLYYVDTPYAIKATFPEARVLVSLRDPVDRFWSHYLMNEAYKNHGLPPEAWLDGSVHGVEGDATRDFLGAGLYERQLTRWFEVFGQDKLLIVFLERMATHPAESLADVFEFLSVSKAKIDVSVRDKEYVEPKGAIGRVALRNRSVRRLGAAVIPARARRVLRTRVLGDAARKPPIPEELTTRLRRFYRDDSHRLEDLLQRPLPWDWHHGPL